MRRFLLIALTTAVLTLAQLPISGIFQSALSEPALGDRLTREAKPAVVRVLSGCTGSYPYLSEGYNPLFGHGLLGSGFFVNPDGYIVTFAVTKNEEVCKNKLRENIAKYIREEYDSSFRIDKISLEKIDVTYHNKVFLPHQDAKEEGYPFTVVKTIEQPLEEGSDISVIKINDVENAPTLKLGSSQDLGNDQVTVIGYSVYVDNEEANYESIFSNTSVYEASLSKGIISNADRRLKDDSPVLELDLSETTYGGAGSPVLNSQGEVVGMINAKEADRNPFLWISEEERILRPRGVPLAIPSSTIQQFIQESGVQNKSGKVDELYSSGLDSFANKDYSSALTKFEAVKRLFKYHSEVDDLISLSNEGLVDSSKPDFLYPFSRREIIVAVVALALVGLIAFFLLRRNRHSSGGFAGRDRDTGYNNVTSGSVPPPNPPYGGTNGASIQALELEFQGQFRRLPLQREEHRLGCDSNWADLVVPETWKIVSSRHAILRREGNSYRIYDGDDTKPSTNGILTEGGTRIDAQGYLLKPGDRLKIGRDPRAQVSIVYSNPGVGQGSSRSTEMA